MNLSIFPWSRVLALFFGVLLIPSCEKRAEDSPGPGASDLVPPGGQATGKDPADRLRHEADIPILEVKTGDTWRYRVTMVHYSDVRTDEPVQAEFERTRVFVGPQPVLGESIPCFEVRSEEGPVIREFVRIEKDRVLLRGQGLRAKDGGTESATLFDPPVLFVRAGLSGGESLPVMELSKDPPVRRKIRVIGREEVRVPAGVFSDAIRLQIFGIDGAVGIRRTYWFAPGVGIVRDEKIRESEDKVLLREKHELIAAPGFEPEE